MSKLVRLFSVGLLVTVSLIGCSANKESGSENQQGEKTSVSEGVESTSKYTEETVKIKNGDYEIPAVVTLPVVAEGEKFPIVVMCHGTGSNKDEAGNGYKMYAPKLAEAGIGSIRFDFIGTGDSTVDYSKYNFETAISDVNTVIEYGKTLNGVNAEKIGIMGWSQGGSIALLAAGQNSDIKSVVTWAGATDLSGLITEEGYEEAKANGFSIMKFDWRDDLNLGLQWYEDVKSTDILAEFSKSPAATLAINGGNDDVVLPENAQKIADAAANKDSKALVVEETDHTLSLFTGDLTKFEEVCKETTNWFADTLK